MLLVLLKLILALVMLLLRLPGLLELMAVVLLGELDELPLLLGIEPDEPIVVVVAVVAVDGGTRRKELSSERLGCVTVERQEVVLIHGLGMRLSGGERGEAQERPGHKGTKAASW